MIFGSYLYDLTSVSKGLSELGYTHTLIGKELSQTKGIQGSHTPQYPIYVVDGLARATHLTTGQPCVIIVCDAKSALLTSNVDHELLFPHYTKSKFLSALKKAVRACAPQPFTIKEPTLQEVIDKVTTKSILTDVQTLVNKVNPYDLRKKVHKYIISYLYGEMPYTKIMKFFNTATKLESLKKIVASSDAKNMRNAVLEYTKTKDEETVSKQFGVHTFEILYVYNSYDRLKDEK